MSIAGTAKSREEAISRNLVICCDGTGNELGRNLSNVLKLFRILSKNGEQLVYYDPGVGTIGRPSAWARLKQNSSKILGLATGYGLDDNVTEAYRWICENWRDGDRLWLFGFSRAPTRSAFWRASSI